MIHLLRVTCGLCARPNRFDRTQGFDPIAPGPSAWLPTHGISIPLDRQWPFVRMQPTRQPSRFPPLRDSRSRSIDPDRSGRSRPSIADCHLVPSIPIECECTYRAPLALEQRRNDSIWIVSKPTRPHPRKLRIYVFLACSDLRWGSLADPSCAERPDRTAHSQNRKGTRTTGSPSSPVFGPPAPIGLAHLVRSWRGDSNP
jgi:hypothetical protein